MNNKDAVLRLPEFFGPNKYLDRELRNEDKFDDVGMLPLDEAFGHYTKSDNTYVTAMIFDQLRGSHNWPITQDIAPLRFLENGSSIRQITFVRHIFNTAFMEEIPTYVAPQIVTRRAEKFTMNLGRIALGFNLEHDFMKTPEGVATYEMNLQQLANALENTLHLRAVMALIENAKYHSPLCDSVGKVKLNQNRVVNPQTFENVSRLTDHILNYEVPLFGATHKYRGLDLLNKTALPILAIDGVKPDTLLLPEHCIDLANFTPEVLSFKYTGIKGNGVPYSEALDKKVVTADGMKIYTYRPFKIDSLSNDLIDPLYSLTRTGEYYTVKYKGTGSTSADHDIKVYDESLDKFCIMKYKDLVKWGYDLIKDCPDIIANLGITDADKNKAIDGTGVLPLDMIILRPNIVHRMGSAIMTKSGSETAETVIGYRSLTLSDDGDAGVHKGNFHCWTGTYVKDPCAVVHIPDVVYGGYKSGNTNRMDDNVVIFVKPGDNDISCLPTVIPTTFKYTDNVLDKSDAPKIISDINLMYNKSLCLTDAFITAEKDRIDVIKKLVRDDTITLSGADSTILITASTTAAGDIQTNVYDKIEDSVAFNKNITKMSSDLQTKLTSADGPTTKLNATLYALLKYPIEAKMFGRDLLKNMGVGSDSHGDMTPCDYLVQGAQYSICGEAKDCKWEFTPSRSHLGETADGVRIVREGRMVYGSSDTSHAIRRRD